MLEASDSARIMGGVPVIVRQVCASTSSDAALLAPDAPHTLTVAAIEQTAGRGQRGNTWEAAPGMNLTFTTLLRPAALPPRDQFALSMAVSLGLAAGLAPFMGMAADRLALKWPNDIYYADLKLGGILIQHTLTGDAIERTLVGVGININQQAFVSQAPNPVSLCHITGRQHDTARVLGCVLESMMRRVTGLLAGTETVDDLLRDYHACLWRNDGVGHMWRDVDSGREFRARVQSVGRDGMLYLQGCPRPYAFKQVEAVFK